MKRRPAPRGADREALHWKAVRERRALLEDVFVPEALEVVREHWPNGSLTLQYGSRGVPLIGQVHDGERREERWILRARRGPGIATKPDLAVDFALDAEPAAMLDELARALRGK